jgi:hypothetical protein
MASLVSSNSSNNMSDNLDWYFYHDEIRFITYDWPQYDMCGPDFLNPNIDIY